MTKNAKIEKSQKEFLKALKVKFSDNVSSSPSTEPLMKETANCHVTLIPYVKTVEV